MPFGARKTNNGLVLTRMMDDAEHAIAAVELLMPVRTVVQIPKRKGLLRRFGR